MPDKMASARLVSEEEDRTALVEQFINQDLSFMLLNPKDGQTLFGEIIEVQKEEGRGVFATTMSIRYFEPHLPETDPARDTETVWVAEKDIVNHFGDETSIAIKTMTGDLLKTMDPSRQILIVVIVRLTGRKVAIHTTIADHDHYNAQ